MVAWLEKRKHSITVLKEALLFRALVLSDTFLCVSVPMCVCVCVSLYRHRGADGMSAAPPRLDQLAFPLL